MVVLTNPIKAPSFDELFTVEWRRGLCGKEVGAGPGLFCSTRREGRKEGGSREGCRVVVQGRQENVQELTSRHIVLERNGFVE